MKSVLIASLVSASALIAATPSFALARLVETCKTSDGQFGLSIINNQGISAERHDHLEATITDAEGNVVGSYDLIDITPRIQPASFRSRIYVDAGSHGQEFTFTSRNTNFPASLKATFSDGSIIDYGSSGSQGQLSCSN